MKNADMPAMPVFSDAHGYISGDAKGLTKREYFAGLAMQGLLSGGISGSYEIISARSVGIADALLSELERTS